MVNHEDVRQHIIAVATRLFVSNGYHGISMREIAEAAGVSKAGIYYHFRDKEALFLGVLTANLERIGSIIEESRQNEESTEAQVHYFIRGIFALTPEQRAIIRLATQEMAHLRPEARQTFASTYRHKFVDRVEGLLREGIERGELRPVDPHVATWALLGMFYPLLYSAHQRDVEPSPEVLQTMLAIFFHGVLKKTP